MKVNIHTHTARCGHAVGTDEEYILSAISAGYTKLGFSDHTPFPYVDYRSGGKMQVEEFEDYLQSIRDLKEKHADQIEIFVGLECEPIPRFTEFLRSVRPQLDYMILGSHGDESMREAHSATLTRPEKLWEYYEKTVYGMETGLYAYIAHPDIMLGAYPAFDDAALQVSRAICREANRLNLPVEYNLLGIKKGHRDDQLGYPCNAFWEVAAEENVRAVVGVDAHAPQMLKDFDMDGAKAYLRGLGITLIEDPTTLF